MSADVVVVGGGHNGLVAAGLLARAGRRVLLLEARDCVGGLCASEEFHPGYHAPGVHHDTSGLRLGLLDALGVLPELPLRAAPPSLFVATGERRGLLLHADPDASADEISAWSERDVRAYRDLRALIARVRPAFERLLEAPAPDISSPESLATKWELFRAALSVRRLGGGTMLEVLRSLPMPLRDFLEDRFETPALQAALAGPALQPVWGGPWSPGTTATFFLREVMQGGGVAGGPARLVAALETACERAGVTVRADAPVASVRVEGAAVRGVTLEDGEEIDARVVVAACDPKQALLELVHPRDLPLRVADPIAAVRARGIVAQVRLALDAPLELEARPGERYARLQIGESLEALERAFDAAKYGGFAAAPHLDVHVPTVDDEALAPEGHEVVSVLVRAVAHDLDADEAQREQILEAVIAGLAAHAPELRDHVVAADLRTPADLRRDHRLTGGHLHHGEHALDQLLSFRPVSGCARSRTPIAGLYLGSGGCHPGGGVSGVPGALAAAAVRKET